MDLEQAKAFFDQFDSDTRAALLAAGEHDIVSWVNRLIEASVEGDAEGQSRARHSLKGLCQNFGASTLLSHCERPLTSPGSVDTLLEYRDLTLRMLREVARP